MRGEVMGESKAAAFMPDREAWDTLNTEDRQRWADSVFSTEPGEQATIPKDIAMKLIKGGQNIRIVIFSEKA